MSRRSPTRPYLPTRPCRRPATRTGPVPPGGHLTAGSVSTQDDEAAPALPRSARRRSAAADCSAASRHGAAGQRRPLLSAARAAQQGRRQCHVGRRARRRRRCPPSPLPDVAAADVAAVMPASGEAAPPPVMHQAAIVSEPPDDARAPAGFEFFSKTLSNDHVTGDESAPSAVAIASPAAEPPVAATGRYRARAGDRGGATVQDTRSRRHACQASGSGRARAGARDHGRPRRRPHHRASTDDISLVARIGASRQLRRRISCCRRRIAPS